MADLIQVSNVTGGSITPFANTFALRLDELIRDTDTGQLINAATVEVIAIRGGAGTRSVVFSATGVTVTGGVVEVIDPALVVENLGETMLVGVFESATRMALLPGTVIGL